KRLAGLIGALERDLPTFGNSEGTGRPDVEVSGTHCTFYHYVVRERDREYERTTTNDIDDLLYTVLVHVSFSVAMRFEIQHRVPGQDFRRLMFQKQIELLASLRPEWAERQSFAHKQFLRRSPFD